MEASTPNMNSWSRHGRPLNDEQAAATLLGRISQGEFIPSPVPPREALTAVAILVVALAAVLAGMWVLSLYVGLFLKLVRSGFLFGYQGWGG